MQHAHLATPHAPPSPTFSPRAFRDAVGHFATGVTIVTAPSDDGPLGVTVNSFTSISLDPPLVLFSASRQLYSLPGLLKAPCYGISILCSQHADTSTRFSKPGAEKWASSAVEMGQELPCHLFKDALARFECVPYATHDAGDHVLFLARVVRFEIADAGEPLVFFRGKYRGLAEMACISSSSEGARS